MSAVDFSAFVGELADRSGDAILPFFRTRVAALDKSGGGTFDPVTEADRAAEATMRRMIRETFPAHGILGEEFGEHTGESDYVWVLDPIDGTKSFICGMPVWGTLIGLTRRGRPVYGMMHQPYLRERFSGDGEAATYEGPAGRRTLRTRPCASLSEATIATTHPLLMKPKERRRFTAVESLTRLSRYGGDCYAYAMLASGLIDIVVEAGLKPYDIVALIPVIEGAGGVVTTWDGGDAAQGGAIVASGDRRVHEEALKLLAG